MANLEDVLKDFDRRLSAMEEQLRQIGRQALAPKTHTAVEEKANKSSSPKLFDFTDLTSPISPF